MAHKTRGRGQGVAESAIGSRIFGAVDGNLPGSGQDGGLGRLVPDADDDSVKGEVAPFSRVDGVNVSSRPRWGGGEIADEVSITVYVEPDRIRRRLPQALGSHQQVQPFRRGLVDGRTPLGFGPGNEFDTGLPGIRNVQQGSVSGGLAPYEQVFRAPEPVDLGVVA